MFLNSNWSKELKYKTYLFGSLNSNNFNTAFPPNFFANYCPYDVWGTQYNTLEGLKSEERSKTLSFSYCYSNPFSGLLFTECVFGFLSPFFLVSWRILDGDYVLELVLQVYVEVWWIWSEIEGGFMVFLELSKEIKEMKMKNEEISSSY